jgi:hypothetical protein
MSLIRRRVSPKKIAANQAIAQKSTGPKRAEKQLLDREAALDRQIADQARLLMQLHARRAARARQGDGVGSGETRSAAPPAKTPMAGDQVRQPDEKEGVA